MNIFLPLIKLHNWLADRDFVWWPFSFLRPEKHELITFSKVLQMSLCFGGMASVMFIGFAVMNNAFDLSSAFLTLLGSFASFYVWFFCVTMPLWNYRARRLQKKK